MIVTSISPERGSDGRGRLHLAEVNLYGWLAYTSKYTSNSPHTNSVPLLLTTDCVWKCDRESDGCRVMFVIFFNLNDSVILTHDSEVIQYKGIAHPKTFLCNIMKCLYFHF